MVNHYHPLAWEGGRDRHGGPGLDKRRAERLPRMLSHQPTGPVEERVREEKRERGGKEERRKERNRKEEEKERDARKMDQKRPPKGTAASTV